MNYHHEYLIAEGLRPLWLDYPRELIDLILTGRGHLIPWHLLESEYAVTEIGALAQRYDRNLVPFAYRQDNDDLACFEKYCGTEVKIIHNHASKGWEDEGSYPSFSAWLEAVEAESIDWLRNS